MRHSSGMLRVHQGACLSSPFYIADTRGRGCDAGRLLEAPNYRKLLTPCGITIVSEAITKPNTLPL
jgi:hypothetical protein